MPQKDLTPDRRIDRCRGPRFGNMSEAEPLRRHARLPIGRLVTGAVLLAGVVQGLAARPLGVPPGDPELRVNGVDANYTTSKLFVDEVAGDAVPLTIIFRPNAADVNPATVQAFTNLNRRDRAQVDANGDGIEDGIVPPSGDSSGTGDEHYYQGARHGGDGRCGRVRGHSSGAENGRLQAHCAISDSRGAGSLGVLQRRWPSRPRHHGVAEGGARHGDVQLNTLVVESTLDGWRADVPFTQHV